MTESVASPAANPPAQLATPPAPAATSATESGRRALDLKGAAFAFFLSCLWAGNPIATKTGLEDSPPLRFGYFRFSLGVIVILAWAFLTRQSLRIERHEVRPLITLGVIFAIQLAFMNYGQYYTTASHAIVIQTTYPLWTAIFAHFLIPGDRLSRMGLAGIMIAYLGVVAVFWRSLGGGQEGVTLLGDFLCLGSAILLAERQVYIAKTSQKISLPKLLVAQGVIGIIIFLGFSLAIERQPFAWTFWPTVGLLYTGLIIAGFGFIGSSWLISKYYPSKVTVINLSQPILGVFLAWLLLGDSIGPELWFGAVCVVIGSYVAQRRVTRKV